MYVVCLWVTYERSCCFFIVAITCVMQYEKCQQLCVRHFQLELELHHIAKLMGRKQRNLIPMICFLDIYDSLIHSSILNLLLLWQFTICTCDYCKSLSCEVSSLDALFQKLSRNAYVNISAYIVIQQCISSFRAQPISFFYRCIIFLRCMTSMATVETQDTKKPVKYFWHRDLLRQGLQGERKSEESVEPYPFYLFLQIN